MTRRRWLRTATGLAAGLSLATWPGGQAGAAPASDQASARARSSAAAPSRAPLRQEDGVLRTADPFGATSLDPVDIFPAFLIQYGMGEALLRITPHGTVEPWLAESVTPLDPLRWRVRLKDGVTFWNGRPLDAEAARTSILRVVAKRKATANLLGLAGVDVVDSLTLDLVTAAPNGAFLASLGGFNLIIHDADEAARVGDEAYASRPVLTGPMIPTAFRPGEFVAARRNDAYWQGTPGLAGLASQAVSDGNARLAAVLAGDVEVGRQIPIQGVAQARAAGLAVTSGDEQAMNQIYLNCQAAPFDEAPVRQAVSLAIDRDLLVAGVLEGSGAAATAVYPRFLPFADPDPYPYDPAGAALLLDGAGWALGSDGVRSRDDRPLAFELLTYPQRPELGLLATVIQSELAAIGMAATIRNVEQITPIVNARAYTATMYRIGTAPTADPGFVLGAVYASWGVDNGQIGYRSEEVDAVTGRLAVAADPAERWRLALDAQAILRRDMPTVPLLSPQLHIAHTPRLHGFTFHPFDYYFVTHRLALA